MPEFAFRMKVKYVMPEVDYPTGTVQVQLDKEGKDEVYYQSD